MERKSSIIPVKVFIAQDSPYTLAENDVNLSVIRKFIIINLSMLALKNIINDLYLDGGSEFGFRILKVAFGKFDIVIILWSVMFLLYCLTFYAWIYWHNKKRKGIVWNYCWICVMISTYLGGSYNLVQCCFKYDLPVASSCLLLMEMSRFIMKSYAFVRTNIRMRASDKEFKQPMLREFMYFSFAPTAVYRKNYPRLKTRNWYFITARAVELGLEIYFLGLIEQEYFLNPLRSYGKNSYNSAEILYTIITNGIPSFTFFFLLFPNSILHTTQNLFAELLLFADRGFYRNWWTVTSMGAFFTAWNRVIQDWLIEYVYKDFYEIVSQKSEFLSSAAVFSLSILMHEVIFMCSTRLSCPIFTATMLVSFFFVKTSRWKDSLCTYIMIFGYLYGSSLIITLPHLEYFARINCNHSVDSLIYKPVLFACNT